MSDNRLLETQADGLSETLHFDADGNATGIFFEQEVSSVVDWCKDAQDGPVGDEFRHAGRYPVGELILYGKLNGIDDPTWYMQKKYSDTFTKLINDAEHKAFRVWGGRV